jgi:hypothetical protein
MPAVSAALILWQIEALEALLEHERGEGRAREQRHKLTVERLRRQVADLQVSCSAACVFATATQTLVHVAQTTSKKTTGTWTLQLLTLLLSHQI